MMMVVRSIVTTRDVIIVAILIQRPELWTSFWLVSRPQVKGLPLSGWFTVSLNSALLFDLALTPKLRASDGACSKLVLDSLLERQPLNSST